MTIWRESSAVIEQNWSSRKRICWHESVLSHFPFCPLILMWVSLLAVVTQFIAPCVTPCYQFCFLASFSFENIKNVDGSLPHPEPLPKYILYVGFTWCCPLIITPGLLGCHRTHNCMLNVCGIATNQLPLADWYVLTCQSCLCCLCGSLKCRIPAETLPLKGILCLRLIYLWMFPYSTSLFCFISFASFFFFLLSVFLSFESLFPLWINSASFSFICIWVELVTVDF